MTATRLCTSSTLKVCCRRWAHIGEGIWRHQQLLVVLLLLLLPRHRIHQQQPSERVIWQQAPARHNTNRVMPHVQEYISVCHRC